MKKPKPLPLFDEPAHALSSSDVCAILNSCRKNQVLKLKCLGLEVEFLDGAEAQAIQLRPRSAAKAPKYSDEEERRGERHQEISGKEAHLDLLAIEDPVAYEKFIQGEDAESDSSMDDES